MRRIILATSLLVALIGVLAACGQPAASGPTLTGVLWQWTEQTIGEPATIPNPAGGSSGRTRWSPRRTD